MNDRHRQTLRPVDMEFEEHYRARSFWQSRTLSFDPPRLTDLPELAAQIRATWSSESTPART